MGMFCRLRRVSTNQTLDLDKNWDFVHFTLTGRTAEDEEETSAPDRLGFVADDRLGGARGEDFGFGPSRLFGASDVRAISDALDTLDDACIAERLASREITRCYPCNEAIPRLDDSDVALIRALSSDVRAFVRACSAAHDALVVEMY